MKAAASFFALQAVSLAIVCGALFLSHRNTAQVASPPRWSRTIDDEAENAHKAILAHLYSRPWAAGDKFEILHSSELLQDVDRFGPDRQRKASIIKVEYIRRLTEPHPESAQPSSQRFVFVLDGSEVLRSLPVDRLHDPYADRF